MQARWTGKEKMMVVRGRYLLQVAQADNEMSNERHYSGVLGAKIRVVVLSERRAHNLLKQGTVQTEDTSGR